MQSRRINQKPCDCLSETFRYIKKRYEEKNGPYLVIHMFEIKECPIHKKTWGKRRKEVKIIKCVKSIQNYELKELDLKFLKSVYSSLWKGKINIRVWNRNLKKYYIKESAEEVTNKYIQMGLIFKKILIIQKNNKENHYILLTNAGKLKIKNLIGFLSTEEQIINGRDRICEVLEKKPFDSCVNEEKIIYNLLKDQLQKIEKKVPGWNININVKIKPTNSATNPPKYLIILYGLCTWLEIYRDNLTLREISARAFQNSQISLDNDPSKMLDKYSKDINTIIQNYSGKSCEELGLILALDSFTFSGELILTMLNGESVKLSGSSVSFSNLSYTKIKFIDLTVDQILLIENFAVFAQLVLDDWANKNNVLLIFIKGMGISGLFRKTILSKILKDNPENKYFVWLDYDLGGCNIYREIINKLHVDTIKIIKIPSELSIPFRNIPLNQIDLIKMYCKSENIELKKFAQFILENGRVEQEYLLEWYKEILNYNFQ